MKLFATLEDLIEERLTNLTFGVTGSLLEVGPYEGSKTKYLCKNKKLKIVGLDSDKDKAKYAKGYEFVEGDARKMPFEEDSFDAVVSFDVIEHIDDDKAFLAESHRVLKSGGVFCVATPNRNKISHKIRTLMGKKITYPYVLAPDVIHLREYTMKELESMVKEAGFTITEKNAMWLGLVGVGGVSVVPPFLREYAQYLMIFGTK